ncbi:MAG: hypothetical protein ABEH35_05535 [Haloarculaceae archaeon]
MSLAKKAGLVVLSIVLTLTLVTTNVVVAAHTTVLDPGFTKQTLEEENAYTELNDAIESSIESQAANGTGGSISGDLAGDLVAEAVSQDYVESQTERNVDRLYAYLHGNRETLNLSVNTEPIKENVSEELADRVRNQSLADLVQTTGNEEQFNQGPVNLTLIERMTANQSSYEAAKADFRSSVRERVLTEMVNATVQQASNDELLALVIEDYDPNDYTEEEKEQMVDDREDEIRAAVREQIRTERSDELDRRVEDALELARQQATDTSGSTPVENATADLQSTVARGLTTDMDYQTFDQEYTQAKDDLAAAISEQAEQRLDEQLPDRMSLSEQLGTGAEQGLQQARNVVQWLDRLAIILPLVALVLVGIAWWATRSVASVTSVLGTSLLFAGLPFVIAADLLRSRLPSLVGAGGSNPVSDIIVGVLDQTVGRLGAQSLVVALLGLVLVGVSLGLRYGLFETARERLEQ